MTAMNAMNGWLTAVRIVLRKELLDGVRDRRALFSALLYPLLGPLLSGLLFGFMADKQRDAADVPMPVMAADRAPELVEWLEAHGVEVVAAPEHPREAVRDGEVPFVVSVPEGFAASLAEGNPAKIELIVDGSRNDSRAAIGHAQKLLGYYGQELASQRLLARGIDPEVMHPVIVAEVEVASDQELAASVFAFVPMFVLMATFIGGMQLAVDATAGERERGSLEPLLLNPVSRSAIVVGKWLAAVAFALGCVILTLVACVAVLEYTPVRDLGLSLDLRVPALFGVLLAAAPMALMAAALQVLVASFARSFKEAQTYISLLVFVPMVPAVIGMMTGLERSIGALLIPGVGQQIVVEQLLGGGAATALDYLLPMLSALVVAAACVWLTAWMFRRESVVFGR
ncbi:ABC-type Na+ efflux pump, permease component [Enhygromyxa salina]|uniref:ABC-type Na+ efflux pump, permease component n=1 Tax=Enhygromyxa salina TaxID=215803 RepID=A0A0C2CW63_9BACT|nr:ABC transporter permease subunit [Enhygromyxa salina]KIG13870.1 ABC-type Na+ efflux pump, permease component [Enhygromyxa salina]